MSKPTLQIPLNQLPTVQAYLESYLESVPTPPPAPLPVPDSTRSFWLNPNANPLASAGSTGPLAEDADVVIIGSGITGVGVAYHLTELLRERNAKANVVIVEARDFCSGATGRNGGHLTPNTFLEFIKHSSDNYPSSAVRAIALERHTVSSILNIISQNSLSGYVDLVEGNHIDLLLTDEETESARKDFEAAEKAGVDLTMVQWLTSDEMQENFGTSYPAVHFPGHNLWPLKLVTKLYTLASTCSSDVLHALHTRTPVTAITPISTGHRQWTVHTPRGNISTSYVVHATNAYASHLLPHLASAIVPTRGQAVAIREYGSRVGKRRMEGWGGNEGFEYWFPRPRPPPTTSGAEHNPLIILGGGREAASPQFEIGVADDSSVNPNVGKVLRGFLPAIFGGSDTKSEWKVEQEWTGIMGYTKTGDPFVGPVLDTKGRSQMYQGQYIAAGYTGHGMPRAFGWSVALYGDSPSAVAYSSRHADAVRSAETVAQLILNNLQGGTTDEWKIPEWLPEQHLTWNRFPKSGRI